MADLNSLLNQAVARGYDRSAVEQCLTTGVFIRFLRPDYQGRNYEVEVARPELGRPCRIQLAVGPAGGTAGCLTCAAEQSNGYAPTLTQDCAAVGATMVAYILERDNGFSGAGRLVTINEINLLKENKQC